MVLYHVVIERIKYCEFKRFEFFYYCNFLIFLVKLSLILSRFKYNGNYVKNFVLYMCALLLLIWIVKVLLHNSSDNFIFLGAETVVIIDLLFFIWILRILLHNSRYILIKKRTKILQLSIQILRILLHNSRDSLIKIRTNLTTWSFLRAKKMPYPWRFVLVSIRQWCLVI